VTIGETESLELTMISRRFPPQIGGAEKGGVCRIALTDLDRQGRDLFVRWAKEFGPPGITTHTWVDMMNLYGQGKAVVLLPSAINGFAAIPGSEVAAVKEHSAYGPSPIGPSGKPIESFWTFSVGVSNFSKDKDAAYKVLAFMTSEPVMNDFATQIGWPYTTYPSIMHGPVLAAKWPKETLDGVEAATWGSSDRSSRRLDACLPPMEPCSSISISERRTTARCSSIRSSVETPS